MRRPVGTLFVTVAVLLLFQTLNLAPYQAWIVFFFLICILIYLKTIKKDLRSNQELLQALNNRVSQSLNERKNASVRSVTEGVRRLNSQKTRLITLLSEKEEQLKYALNRWVDFQKTYTEIKNINDWFEQREETLSRYQRIVTQREFEIALEDVKVRICRGRGLFSVSPPLFWF